MCCGRPFSCVDWNGKGWEAPTACACAGRWRGGSVAVKIITHDRRISRSIEAQCRESMLSAHIQHPNVVTTYKASALCRTPPAGSPLPA
jgi:hypothetical protein